MEKITFSGYNLFIKQYKTDKGWQVQVDVGECDYNNIKEIPNLPEGVYKIEITPMIETLDE